MFKRHKSKNIKTMNITNDRVFIVGDIHGNWIALSNLLDQINYDPTTDMILSVGDLIDRGPNSKTVLDFFTDDNELTQTVMGNHEYMVFDNSYQVIWLNNGGHECLDDFNSNEIDNHDAITYICERIYELPISIQLKMENEIICQIAHAGWPNIMDKFHQRISFNDLPQYSIYDIPIQHMLWSREEAHLCKRSNKTSPTFLNTVNLIKQRLNIDTYIGHSQFNNVKNIGPLHFIDTGPHTLTMINPITLQTYSYDSITPYGINKR